MEHAHTRLANTATAFALAASTCAWSASPASAQEGAPASDGEIKPSRLFEMAKPGTVLIQTSFQMDAQVPNFEVPASSRRRLLRKMTYQVRVGNVRRDIKAITAALLRELAENPGAYITQTGRSPTREKVEIAATGSGFVLTPDGVVVTNAHLAAPEDAVLKRQLAEKALIKFVKRDIGDLTKSLGGTITPEIQSLAQKLVLSVYARTMTLSNVRRRIVVAMGVTVPGLAVVQKGIPCELIVAGEPIPGKDVALIKMQGKNNLPTLPLGDDTTLKTGERLYIIGYPGAATFHPVLSKESQIEPTFTQGLISARKTMAGGWSVLQTDAAMTHGNSGGPALNERGEVIGLATFGSTNASGQAVAGLNFIVPISIAREFLQKARIEPKQGEVSQMYTKALRDSDAGDHKSALALLTNVNNLSPGHPYVQEQIAEEQKAVNASGGGGLAEASGQSTSTSASNSKGAPGSSSGSGLLLLVPLVAAIGAGAYFIGKRSSGGPPSGGPPSGGIRPGGTPTGSNLNAGPGFGPPQP